MVTVDGIYRGRLPGRPIDDLARQLVYAFQAEQTAYSIWWAVYATALIILGFVRPSRAARYLALVLFAVTLVKVFLVDMARVEAVYRILSFLCLGTLLLAGSWLYHRYFREKLAA